MVQAEQLVWPASLVDKFNQTSNGLGLPASDNLVDD